jgi:hypothetical protein
MAREADLSSARQRHEDYACGKAPAEPALWFTQNIDAEDGTMITVERDQGSPFVRVTITGLDTPPVSVWIRPPALAALVTALKKADPGIGTRSL